MTRKPVVVRAIGSRTTEVDGPGVFDVCADLNVPKTRPRDYGGGKTCWWIPQDRADDVMAALEHRGFTIVVTL